MTLTISDAARGLNRMGWEPEVGKEVVLQFPDGNIRAVVESVLPTTGPLKKYVCIGKYTHRRHYVHEGHILPLV